MSTATPTSTKRIVVLISGSGSNLQAIMDACTQPDFNAQVVGVISNRPGVKGLVRAEQQRIATRTLDHTQFANREQFDAQLAHTIDQFRPDLVVLAGFMRILTPALVARYQGRMLNIHPSLLPKYPGLHTHRRAIEAGDQEHGVTVHFVTPELDGGPPVLQARVPVLPEDTEVELAARVLNYEHRIYPMAIHWFAKGRLALHGGQAYLDGEPLPAEGRLIDAAEAEL